MASLNNDITDPLVYKDYPDVERLETTNKVYGGVYTAGDDDQGISNFQAMRLMERDNYILRRVGVAAEAPSGDLPGKPGIASLDTIGKVPDTQIGTNVTRNSENQTLTNKTISFADNTLTGVASTSTAQTLTNKTISFADNTLTGVASVDTAQTITNKTISFADNTLTGVASTDTAQTLTNKTIDKTSSTFTCSPTFGPDDSSSIPVTKEMNLVLGSASTQAPYSIGNGPYAGFELRITVTDNANAPFAVSFLSGGATVTKNLSVGVHHLTWQDSSGWTFYELSGEYTDNTTFTYLL